MRVLTATCHELAIGKFMCDKANCGYRETHDLKDIEYLLDAFDVYLVFACVEVGDNVGLIKKIAGRVFENWSKYRLKYRSVVIVPFGHLSNRSQKNKKKIAFTLEKLLRVLRNKGAKVDVVSPDAADFLMSKMLFFDDGFSVRFSSSSDALEEVLGDMIKAYGIGAVLEKFAKIIRRMK